MSGAETLVSQEAELSNSVRMMSGTGAQECYIELRDGHKAPFNVEKIRFAITKAFLAQEGDAAEESERIHEHITHVLADIQSWLQREVLHGRAVYVEKIQDKIEDMLMHHGHYAVARRYIIYREERRQNRLESIASRQVVEPLQDDIPSLEVTLSSGKRYLYAYQEMRTQLHHLCQDIDEVDIDVVAKDAFRSLYDGVLVADIDQALVMSARTYYEREPNYTYVAARVLRQQLLRDALGYYAISLGKGVGLSEWSDDYTALFPAYIEKGVALGLLDKAMHNFDLDKIVSAICCQRDRKLTYFSMQTIYDRYLLHDNQVRLELPQFFFMRVAMGLAFDEVGDKTQRAIEFYDLLSQLDYMTSTPTLFNAGTCRPQLSSCFLTTVPDDLDGIYSALKDNALLSKFAGGLGNDWTNVRAEGAKIKGTHGESLGITPFLNVADASAIAVNQGGKRKGAVCGYLETWHMDIEAFLELRKNTGDDRRRTHDMNTANWVPDLFMIRVLEKGKWTLFSPDDVPDLHDLYGQAFKEAYEAYEVRAERGEIRSKSVKAIDLWRKMLSMLYETGHPWVIFKDPCNIRSPQQHAGVVHSSNLCTEITLNTKAREEIAVCNLGSINLVQHIDVKTMQLDLDKLKRTVKTAIRMLDNVIDINYYTVEEARASNLRHRPIGLGLMGFQDALHLMQIPYQSEAAVDFADKSMEYVSYCAIEASMELAQERGKYDSFEGSLWSQGILPIDSVNLLKAQRGDYLDAHVETTLDWDSLRQKVKKKGMRNSNVLAIAPTATISNICGVSQSIEPSYQNLYVKSNMSGEFTVINTYLVKYLKDMGLWDEVMVNDLKYYDGSLRNITRIPKNIRKLFATAFEMDPKWLVRCAARRMKWIDQSQSLNLYMAQPSGKKLQNLYELCFRLGLKSTYYLRTIGATSAEKSTVQRDGALNAVSTTPKACAIDDPDCEACQ